MKKHTYYEPTEYEQILIAAGWITLADVDDDYLEYFRSHDMTYEEWLQSKRDWDTCQEEYMRVVQPYYDRQQNNLPDPVWQTEKRLLDRMSTLEFRLGY